VGGASSSGQRESPRNPGELDMHSLAQIAPAYDGHCHAFIDRPPASFNNQSIFFD
jgi:hypothetical protein